MNEEMMIPMPEACARAMTALEADPLEPGAEAEAHLRGCAACAEAQVLLLAQEDASLPLAPAGYFEALPGRVLRKLPATKARRRLPTWIWAAAAALLVAGGLGGYLAGRTTAVPTVAPMAQQLQPADIGGLDRAMPFHDRDEDMAEVGGLSQAEMKDLVSTLDGGAASKGTRK